jgi:hypothetical protein
MNARIENAVGDLDNPDAYRGPAKAAWLLDQTIPGTWAKWAADMNKPGGPAENSPIGPSTGYANAGANKGNYDPATGEYKKPEQAPVNIDTNAAIAATAADVANNKAEAAATPPPESPTSEPKLYKGGYTGEGGKYEPAGTVHKGEYVIPKEGVDQKTHLPKGDHIKKILSDRRLKKTQKLIPIVYRRF